jgi:hypothetical protein
MFNPAVKIAEMKRDLEGIPQAHLAEVDLYLKSFLQKKSKSKPPKSLRGIWAGKGFEKIINTEKEVILSRKELGKQILGKQL